MRGQYDCHDGMCGALDCKRCHPEYSWKDFCDHDEDGNPIDENGEVIEEPCGDYDEYDLEDRAERRGWR